MVIVKVLLRLNISRNGNPKTIQTQLIPFIVFCLLLILMRFSFGNSET